MAAITLRADSACANDFVTVQELGEHIHRISALLQAAINTGAGEEEDEGWLVGIAHDEAHAAKERYLQWSRHAEGGNQ
jgi:hypothetical protein